MLNSQKPITIALYILITVAIFYGFAPSIHPQFVDWDDFDNFVKNPWFVRVTAKSFIEVWHSVMIGVYQPLAWTALLVQRVVFGLNALSIHAVSVVLHAINSLLTYQFTLSFLKAQPITTDLRAASIKLAAALATLGMMLHPLRVEPVAWASCQPYLWAAMWGLVSLNIYLSVNTHGATKKPWLKLLALVCFACSLLSKTWLLGLPLILLLLDYYPLGRFKSHSSKQIILEKIPYFVLSVIGIMLGLWARSQVHELQSFDDRSLSERLARVGIALTDYMSHIIAPTHLAPFYPEPPHPEFWSQPSLTGWISCITLLVLAWMLRVIWPGFLVALVSFLILLSPNLGFIPTGRVIGADRYTYLTAISITPMLAYGIVRVSQMHRLGLIVVSLCGSVAISSLLHRTRDQTGFWNDSISLWQRSLDMATIKTAELYFNVARSWQLAGQDQKAIDLYQQSLAVDPNYHKSLQNLGAIYLAKKQFELASTFISRQLAIRPTDPGALSNMGLALAALGRAQEAHEQFVQAVLLSPQKPDFTLNLALFYLQIQQDQLALQTIDSFYLQAPPDHRLDLVYARILLRLNRLEEARSMLASATSRWADSSLDVRELVCLHKTLQTTLDTNTDPKITDTTCKAQ